MNNARDIAFEDFKRLGIPSKKIERYKYTDMKKLFEPDYGLNLKRLDIPARIVGGELLLDYGGIVGENLAGNIDDIISITLTIREFFNAGI